MANNSIWPTAAASRVRIKFSNDDYCRLFYNQSTGSIDLVALTADDVSKLSTTPHAEIYDNSQPTDVEQDPSYQSYLSQSRDGNKHVLDSFHPDNVIGANLSLEYNLNNPNTFHGMQSYATAQINIYCYPKSNRKKQRYPKHKTYTVDSTCCEDFSDVRALIDAIRNSSGLHNINNRAPPQRFLVILNPFSGGNGPKSKTGATFVYETMLKPMLEQAGVEHDKLVTTHGGHAKERMEFRKVDSDAAKNNNSGDGDDSNSCIDSELNDISEYDSIIAMGGDGILFEIFQGINARSDEAQILSKVKFGIIPCGTCNGLAASILHWSDGADYTPMESVFQICKGNSSRLDLASYQLANTSKTYTSFLSFSWGLIADCDLDSECLRWLGALRADIWAVYRGILFPKKYRARLSYLPPQNNGDDASAPKIKMPKVDEPISNEWVTIEDDISVFWVCNTSHASFNMFTCPMSKMNDGVFYILIVRSSVSRLRLLQILLKLESGKHIDCNGLEVVCCSAYRLEPLTNNTYNDLDGELIEDGPIQASISNSARFFAGKVDV